MRNARTSTSLVMGAIVLGALSTAAGGRATPPSILSDDSEARVAMLVRSWFTLLKATPPEASAIDDFLTESPLEFALAEDGNPGPGELRAWISEVRSAHAQIEYQIGTIRTDRVGPDEYRVRFEVEKRGLDLVGVPHIARSEHDWVIRDLPAVAPTILRIDEKRLLAFAGTGPQIICY